MGLVDVLKYKQQLGRKENATRVRGYLKQLSWKYKLKQYTRRIEEKYGV